MSTVGFSDGRICGFHVSVVDQSQEPCLMACHWPYAHLYGAMCISRVGKVLAAEDGGESQEREGGLFLPGQSDGYGLYLLKQADRPLLCIG